MILSCPDKNTTEWKRLVTYLGSEQKAMAAYYANGSEIPSIEELEAAGKTPEEAPRFQRVIDNLKRQEGILALFMRRSLRSALLIIPAGT